MPEATSSRRRTAWGFWVPLTVTVAVATLGVAAWVINRQDNEEEAEAGLDYYDENDERFGKRDRGEKEAESGPEMVDRETAEKATAKFQDDGLQSNWQSRMHEALARTPSPSQFFHSAVGGLSAASAAVANTLQSIREEDKSAFQDHETWSEEADAKHNRGANINRNTTPQPKAPSKQATPVAKSATLAPTSPENPTNRPSSRISTNSRISSHPNRKTVAIVVSADFAQGNLDDQAFHEQASLLSHIPKNLDFNKIKLFVIIYAPCLKDKETAPGSGHSQAPPSLSSSFSNIGHDQAQPSEAGSPLIHPSSSVAVYNSIYSQALNLVENDAMVLHYSSPMGHMHLLRTLNPELIYMQESLTGDKGSYITQLQTWYRYDVIVVVGAEGGSGGIADSECETENMPKTFKLKWWQIPERVSRGKGIVVVDGPRLQDDWVRRLEEGLFWGVG